LTLRAGPLRIDLLKLIDKAKKPKKEKPGKEKKPAIPQISLKALPGAAKPLMNSLRKGIRVDRFILRLTLAGEDDPCSAALTYGKLHIVWGVLNPVMNEYMRVKKQRVDIGLDFDKSKTKWEGDIAVSISLGRSVLVSCVAFKALLNARKAV
jgi:hypothetical protein